MRFRHQQLLALTAAALGAACASSSRSVDSEPSPTQSPAPATTPATPAEPTAGSGAASGMGMGWQGTIRPESGTRVGGTVMIMPGTGGQSTATITLTDAPANGTHPWHVHSGTCAEKGPIVGSPSAYPPLSADASGAARLETTLPFATPTSGNYSVNVHMSPTQMGMVVGCADLAMHGS
jgi:hypothetical protein